MSPHRRSRLAVLARLVVVVLVAVFAWPTLNAACCVGVEAVVAQLSGAGDCCPSRSGGEEDPQKEHQGACSCPLSCASGCTGLGRAVVITAACEVKPAGFVALVPQQFQLSDPLAPDPNDILHVPKRVAA